MNLPFRWKLIITRWPALPRFALYRSSKSKSAFIGDLKGVVFYDDTDLGEFNDAR